MEVFLCSFIAMEGSNEILPWDVTPGIEIRVLNDSLVPSLSVQYSFTGIETNGGGMGHLCMYVCMCKSVKWKTRKGGR